MYFCVVYCICDSVCLIVCISDGFGQFIKAVLCLEDIRVRCDADGLDAHK